MKPRVKDEFLYSVKSVERTGIKTTVVNMNLNRQRRLINQLTLIHQMVVFKQSKYF